MIPHTVSFNFNNQVLDDILNCVLHVTYNDMGCVSSGKNLQVTGLSLTGACNTAGQGGSRLCLEWRSMSGDTSGDRCQGKLS